MAGRWKSWLLMVKERFLASFGLFNALRACLSGEVVARNDFKARGTVFLQKEREWAKCCIFASCRGLREPLARTTRTHEPPQSEN